MWIIWLGRTENDPHFCKADADLLATMPSYYKLSKFGLIFFAAEIVQTVGKAP